MNKFTCIQMEKKTQLSVQLLLLKYYLEITNQNSQNLLGKKKISEL